MTYHVVVSIVTGVNLVACLTFVVGYWWSTGGTWIRDEAGRFMMALTSTLAALFALVLVNQWVGEWPGRRPVTVVVFVAFGAILWWPLRLLYIAQSRRRRGRKTNP